LPFLFCPVYRSIFTFPAQLCEITTPFLHVRWFLSKLGLKHTFLYRANGITFSVLFVLVRGVLMTIMYYRIWSRMPNLLYHAGCASCTVVMTCAWAFQALQYIWCVKVVAGALAFFRTGDEAGSSGPKPRKAD
jgi:TLC domain